MIKLLHLLFPPYLILPIAFRILVGVQGYSVISWPMALDTAIRMAAGAGEGVISPKPTAWKDSLSHSLYSSTVSNWGKLLKVRHL